MLQKSICIKNIKRIALFGNPIKHSLSPIIHKYFSKKTNIKYLYIPLLCNSSNFFFKLSNFFNQGGFGANVTVPFKKTVFSIVDKTTKFSQISKTVNTLTKISDTKKIVGDNTDGLGLIYDLKRLFFLQKSKKILLLGAGGAANSIIYHLLLEGCKIFIHNRTVKNSYSLIQKFLPFGKVILFEEKHYNNFFDIIINSTSCGIFGKSPCFPKILIHKNIFCYDMFYHKDGSLTPFLLICKKLGAKYLSDGIGMLVAQAAYSFFSWFYFLPDISKTINFIKLSRNLK